jgi:hypothetical protein
MPRLEHIWLVRLGHELPAKINVLRILMMFVKEGMGTGEENIS